MLKMGLITVMVLTATILGGSSEGVSMVQLGAFRNEEVESARVSRVSDEQGDELREEFHQTYPLSPNGRVSIENLNGSVRISVWDRSDIQVDAIKHAYKRERLNEANIEVSASPEAIRIKTNYPDFNQSFTDEVRGRLNNPAIVDYSITIPRQARLESIDLVNGSLEVDGAEGDIKASSVNGRVIARGLMGVAKLSTVNGGLEVTFTRLDELKPISLGSVNGSVVLIIPSDANAVIKAGTVHGAISNDFGLDVHHGEYVGHELYGQLGTGGARIKLGNVNGRIAIKNSQDGRTRSSATSLLSEKHKEKTEEEKDYGEADQAAERKMSAEARRQAAEARRAEHAQRAEAARTDRETHVEVQREVERAIREAHREIERAQREIELETRQVMREKVRREIRGEGEGVGEGKGSREGKGTGKGAGKGISYKGLIERESKSFSVPGSPRVNIITFDGTVTVHGWDKPEVMYTATKRGDDEQEIKQVKIQAEQQGSAVSVIAASEEGNGSASLDVHVPRNATLHVSSGDGQLNLQGVSGDLTLRTGDGAIEVVDGRGQLEVNTGDGHIRISNFDGQVDARTGDGAITLDGNFSGLAARTGDGSISLSVPVNSDFTIETNAEGIDNEGLTVSEDVAPSKRVKRWKVGRGGNVFVLSTGEGKILLHSR